MLCRCVAVSYGLTDQRRDSAQTLAYRTVDVTPVGLEGAVPVGGGLGGPVPAPDDP
jgi:hypothetical protein